MKNAVVYIHGKGGNAGEAGHYEKIFVGADVIGFDYKSQTPWKAKEEFPSFFKTLKTGYGAVTLIANSIGAYFSMNATIDGFVDRAFFISPIVDMEKLICDMMTWAGINEDELRKKKEIPTDFGETLSWDYLVYARKNPAVWTVPSSILYGAGDNLTSYETITGFAKNINADLTVMPNGEHWFHTDEQMAFLDKWILDAIKN